MDTDELRSKISLLEPVSEERGESVPWDSLRVILRKKILEFDPEDFLAWPSINGTMLIGNGRIHRGERKELEREHVGPWPSVPRFGLLNKQNLSARLRPAVWHQLYHLHQYMKAFDVRIADIKSICEIGGGFGMMRYVCDKLGFTGDYWIIDLPEMMLLQEYYLSHVKCRPTKFTRSYSEPQAELLIAANSLSEMHLSERVVPYADSYLFAYHKYFGIDNLSWFRDITLDRPDYDWHTHTHFKFSNLEYTVGKRI